jgi:acyl-CoA synthetase (NDP forming)
MSDQLRRLFNPDSVAVVGASINSDKRGYRTIQDLEEWGYDGDIYPVNPRYDEIRGLETFASVADIPGGVDLVFITIPAEYVPEVIRESGEAGAAGAVVNTAGFSEVGKDDLEADLMAAARDAGVRIVGPNIQGIDAVHQHLHLLGSYRTTPGRLGLLTQSGNMGVDMSVDAQHHGNVGFSYNIGVGNETDLQFHEYLSFLETDEHTDGVAIYAEGMENGRSFLQTAQRVSREKPIVAFKAGKTSVGKDSAASHSASLAGDIDVIDAAYRQAGVTRVDSLDLVVPVAEALTKSPIPDGPNVAVLTDGGGHGTVASDVLSKAGLTLPELDAETQARLEELFPISPNRGNPVDVMGQSSHIDMWAAAPEIILADPNVDMLLITGAYGGYEEHWIGHETETEPDEEPRAADRIIDARQESGKPVVVHSLFSELGSEAFRRLRAGGVPVHDAVTDAVACLQALAEYGRHQQHAEEKSDFVLQSRDENRSSVVNGSWLSEYDAKHLLTEYGVPVTPFDLATTADEAVNAAAAYDGPVAMKVVSPGIVHKTEAGGVKLNVTGDTSVQAAFEDIVTAVSSYYPSAAIDGVLVSPMVGDGIELIVGVVEDAEIGPVIMCGIGGILVEAIDDVVFRALPLTEYDAAEMIDDIEAQALLDGPRDLPAVDRDVLAKLLLAVSELMAENPSIAELDLNPVIATEDGLSVVDATVKLE